jgi:hypothetical protein
MVQIYFKKWEYTARGFNKISTNFNILLSFFHLQPILCRKKSSRLYIQLDFLRQ